MYSFILVLTLLTQTLVVGGSYLMQDAALFYNVTVYGSPFYSAMTILRSDSALLDNNPLYIGMLLYHLLKYGLFFLAQRNEGYNKMLITSAVLEAAYLCTSAYYLN